MKLEKLTATNFLSFKELDYDFVDSPVLIQGENDTDENQESNGAGKSSVQAAIEFCLFKTTSRKVRDIELIHFGTPVADLSLSIFCPIRNERLLIERRIRLKGTGESQVSVNGKVVYSFEDKVSSEIDRFILGWIDIAKEDLQNYFIVNKERYKSIFSSSNKEKVELINRFSNAKLIEGVDKFVQVDIDAINIEIKKLESVLSSLDGSINTLRDEIDVELNRDIETEKQTLAQNIFNDTERLENQIKVEMADSLIYGEQLVALKPELEEALGKLKKISTIIQNFVKIDISEELNEIDVQVSNVQIKRKGLETKLYSEVATIKEMEGYLSDIEKNLAGTITCPKCNHQFVLNKDIDLEDEKSQLEEIQGLLKTYATVKLKTENDIAQMQRQMELLRSQKNEVYAKTKFNDRWEERFRRIKRNINVQSDKLTANIEHCQKQVSLCNNRIESAKFKISLNEKKLAEIQSMSIDHTRIKNLKAKISDLEYEIDETKKKVEEKKIDLFRVSQWTVNFKKFNMFLANQSLKVIQGYCNKFLQDLRSDIQVKWEGMKALANGSLKEEITSYVIRDGEQRDFWSFSGGERARMEYAMFFTLQTMINKTHKYGGLDFFSSDEVVEGLDAQGLSDLMKSLSTMNRAVLLTTHVVNRNINDNILLVRKVNGVSEIIKN